MSHPQFQQPRRSKAPLIIVLVVLGMCGICTVTGVLSLLGGRGHPGRTADPVAVRSSIAVAPADVTAVDQASLAAYWTDNFEGTSWWELASVPTWDGNVLTVPTTLVADADAVAPATAMCAAASGFWFTSGQDFHSVRVVDSAGVVLVSRHVVGDQCTWRR